METINTIFITEKNLFKTQFNMHPAPIADKAMQRKSVLPGGEAHSALRCSLMSNARIAALNTTARQANPTGRISLFISSPRS